MLLQGGQALQAREQFEIIVRHRPAYVDAAAMRGVACYLAGDGLAAKAVGEDCRERRPEDPRVEAYLAMLARNDTGPPAGATTAPAEASPPEAEGHGGPEGRGGKKKRPCGARSWGWGPSWRRAAPGAAVTPERPGARPVAPA